MDYYIERHSQHPWHILWMRVKGPHITRSQLVYEVAPSLNFTMTCLFLTSRGPILGPYHTGGMHLEWRHAIGHGKGLPTPLAAVGVAGVRAGEAYFRSEFQGSEAGTPTPGRRAPRSSLSRSPPAMRDKWGSCT